MGNVKRMFVPETKIPLRFDACPPKEGGEGWSVVDQQGYAVAAMVAPHDEPGAADLFAAAPELRDAVAGLLETFVAVHDGKLVTPSQARTAIIAAHRALKKAGEWRP